MAQFALGFRQFVQPAETQSPGLYLKEAETKRASHGAAPPLADSCTISGIKHMFFFLSSNP